MNNIENITKALNNALFAFGVTNLIDIALNNYDERTNTSTPYLASRLLNTGVNTADFGFSDKRSAIYQININYKKGVGSTALNKMADLLNEEFKTGKCFEFNGTCVCVDNFQLDSIIIDNGWAMLPISITTSAYTAQL